MPLFLGFDCSTQGLAALVLERTDREARIVFEHALDFDRDFPEYHTEHGVWRSADGLEVTSSPLMWAAALERMMEIVSGAGFDLSRLAAIAGSAQQHGSVYLNERADAVFQALDAGRPLADQLPEAFSRQTSPVWMDASTTPQCEAIARSLGGAAAVAALTGSAPFERFTGPQIRRFFEERPDEYARTRRIHLVSSFMASLLVGREAPIEPGDGAGMNLMDIRSLDWAPAALAATAPDLRSRLPPIVPSSTLVGPLASYWRTRFGFAATPVAAWTGDNPSSLVGTRLFREGHVGISLGTSDTIFGFTAEPRPSAGGSVHVFGSPAGGFMSLICFKNGALAREAIRDRFGLDWAGFSRALRDTPPGNGGALMLPWFEAEITPRAEAGVQRLGLDADDAAANVRAVVEAQMMAMATHSAFMTGGRVERIRATGGGSVNREILQVMADVFGAEVSPAAAGNAACLGAVLRACHANELAHGRAIDWDGLAGMLDHVDARTPPIVPQRENVAVYRILMSRYAQFEGTFISPRRT